MKAERVSIWGPHKIYRWAEKAEELVKRIQLALGSRHVFGGMRLQYPPGAAVILDETVGFNRSPGAGLVLGEPALARLFPGFQDLRDPSP